MKSARLHVLLLLSALLAAPSCAWSPLKGVSNLLVQGPFATTCLGDSTRSPPSALHMVAALSRRQALQTAVAGSSAAGAAAFFSAGAWVVNPAMALADDDGSSSLPNGVTYTVSKRGDGPKPDLGELVAIRFAAYAGDLKIDDIFGSPEPYYTRIGSGPLIKGVEDALPYMRVGDRWVLTIPGKVAFGEKGRPASPGRPRIPPNAVITFDVEMVGLPGKEPELIELIGDV